MSAREQGGGEEIEGYEFGTDVRPGFFAGPEGIRFVDAGGNTLAEVTPEGLIRADRIDLSNLRLPGGTTSAD